jgi:hypothetical protein
MLLIDEPAALAAIPGLLPDDIEERRNAFAALREVLEARGPLGEAATERLGRVQEFFALGSGGSSARPQQGPTVLSSNDPASASQIARLRR